MTNIIPALEHNLVATIIAVFAVVGIAYWYWGLRDNINFADFWARHWLIRKWRKQTVGLENRNSWEKEGLPPTEKELCDYYLRHVKGVRQNDFENASRYLALTHQSATRPMAFWALIILFVLTAAEASQTGAFVAPFVSRLATGNEITWITYAIALVLAIVLLVMTHKAGKDWRKREAIKKNIGNWDSSDTGHYKRGVTSGEDQSVDEFESPSVRFANRVLDGAHDRGSMGAVVFVAVVIIVLMVAIFGGRIYQNESLNAAQATDQTTIPTGCAPASGSASTSSTDPFSNVSNSSNATAKVSVPGFSASVSLPADVNCSAQTATNNANKQINDDEDGANLFASIILALIYLVTQAVGFFFSYQSAFYGDGKIAYEITLGEASYSTYETHYITPTFLRAGALLTKLRGELGRRVRDYGLNPSTLNIREYFQWHYLQSPTQQPLSAAPMQPKASAPAQQAAPTGVSEDEFTQTARQIIAASTQDEKVRILEATAQGNDEVEDKIIAIVERLKAEQNAAALARAERRKSL